MAIPGINFFNEGENSIKLNNPGAPQFMNTIFGAEPAGGAMGVDAFEAAEPKEAPSGVDAAEATEPADPADPSEAPRRTTKKTTSKYVPSEKTVRTIADSWAKKWNIPNKNGEFTKFVRKVYELAEKLNIKETSSSKQNRFPHIEDQIVDEILAIFAEEASFDPKAIGKEKVNGKYIDKYYGIFQLTQESMDECDKKGFLKKHGLKRLKMSSFKQLSREKQLDYLIAYAELGKVYSKISDNEKISPKILFSFIKGLGSGKRASIQKICSGKIAKRQKERGQINIT